jgi:hypothetical protein
MKLFRTASSNHSDECFVSTAERASSQAEWLPSIVGSLNVGFSGLTMMAPRSAHIVLLLFEFKGHLFAYTAITVWPYVTAACTRMSKRHSETTSKQMFVRYLETFWSEIMYSRTVVFVWYISCFHRSRGPWKLVFWIATRCELVCRYRSFGETIRPGIWKRYVPRKSRNLRGPTSPPNVTTEKMDIDMFNVVRTSKRHIDHFYSFEIFTQIC